MKELLKKIKTLVTRGALGKDGTIEMKNNRSYAIRTEEAVLGHLRPILSELNLVVTVEDIQSIFCNSTTIKLIVKMRIFDVDTGESLAFAGVGSGIDPADKDAGKAFTYAYRNGLQKLVMMVSGEDSDSTSSEKILENMRTEGVHICERLWKLNAFHAPKEGSDVPCDDELATTRYQKRVALISKLSTAGELNEILTSMRAKESELKQA